MDIREQYQDLESVSTNFFQVVPDSHYWTSLEMLMSWLSLHEKLNFNDLKDLKIGLENTIKNGYNLTKKDEV